MSCTDCASNEIKYVGNDARVLYPFPFVYLTENDVYVELYNFTTRRWEKTTEWTFANATNVQFNTAPEKPPSTDPNYPNIKIARCTDIDPLAATFYPGSAIRAQDLNNNFEQLQMAIQEGRCKVPDWVFDYLDKYYWNKDDETLKSGDAWVSDNEHIATTAAGDARWLNATGGDIVGGDGITVQESTPNVGNTTISQETLDPDPTGTYLSANITVDKMGRVISAADGGGGPAGGQVKVVPNIAALNTAFAATPEGDVYQITDSTGAASASPAISGLPAASTIVGGYGADVRVNCVRATTNWTFLSLVFPNPDTRYVNQTGDTMTGPLVLDDTSLQIQEGSDTLTITANALTGDRAVTFPDKGGTVAMTSDLIPNTDTTYTLPVTGTASTGVLTLTGSDGTTDPVTITAGDNLSVSNVSGAGFTLNASGGDVGVENDGTSVVAKATTLNFTGVGVTVTDGGSNQANIAITGGGDGGVTGTVSQDVYGTAKAYCQLDISALTGTTAAPTMDGVEFSRGVTGVAVISSGAYIIYFKDGLFDNDEYIVEPDATLPQAAALLKLRTLELVVSETSAGVLSET